MTNPKTNTSIPWRVSLHGGHTGEFCDHGHGTLAESIEAAFQFGYHTFGVAEHAPRAEARFLYPEEIARGWDTAKIAADFDRYAQALLALAQAYAGRLTILRGFEAEMVPPDRYAQLMFDLRHRYDFDYIVGSVHWVGDIIIDYNKTEFDRATAAYGGWEPLVVKYFEALGEMAGSLKPEVVGHLDVIRKFAPDAPFDSPAIRDAATAALEAVKANGCILDINAAPLRKGRSAPYPSGWLLELARDMGIPVCFGDDSHGPRDVGGGIEAAREYLLRHAIREVTYLTKTPGGLARQTAPLE